MIKAINHLRFSELVVSKNDVRFFRTILFEIKKINMCFEKHIVDSIPT